MAIIKSQEFDSEYSVYRDIYVDSNTGERVPEAVVEQMRADEEVARRMAEQHAAAGRMRAAQEAADTAARLAEEQRVMREQEAAQAREAERLRQEGVSRAQAAEQARVLAEQQARAEAQRQADMAASQRAAEEAARARQYEAERVAQANIVAEQQRQAAEQQRIAQQASSYTPYNLEEFGGPSSESDQVRAYYNAAKLANWQMERGRPDLAQQFIDQANEMKAHLSQPYRVDTVTTGGGGNTDMVSETVLVTPGGNVPVVQNDQGEYLASLAGSSSDVSGAGTASTTGATINPQEIAKQEETAKARPYGTGEGQALGYEYGIKNFYGDVYKKYDAQGNLTEFLDKDGKWQKASDVKPVGTRLNPETGNLDTVYEYGGRKDIVGNTYVPGMSPYKEDQGGFLGEGGWKNIGMLVATGLSAGLAAGAGGAGLAGAAGANLAESAAAMNALLQGGSTLGNALQIGNQLVNIGTTAYEFLKQQSPEIIPVIEKLQSETKKNEAAGMSRDQAVEAAMNSISETTPAPSLATPVPVTTAPVTPPAAELPIAPAPAPSAETLFAELTAKIATNEAAGMSRSDATNSAIEQLAGQLNTTEQALLDSIAGTKSDLTQQVKDVETGLGGQITDLEKDLATELGSVKTDVAGVETTLLDQIAKNEMAGMTRDQALQAAITGVSTQLGLSEQNLLTNLGLTKAELGSQISNVETNLGGRLDQTEQSLLDAIGRTETNLGGQITGVGTQVTDLTKGFTDFADYTKQQDEESRRRRQGEEAVNLLSQMATGQVKTPPPAEIDYFFDIGGDSMFATPKQESLMPSPFEEAPEAVEGAMPRYQYYDPKGGYLYADGGMVAFDEGGDVTQEELEAALRPATFNPRIAASGETSRRNKAEALARQEQGPEDTVVDEYGNVIRFSDYGRPAPTLEESVQQLTGMQPGLERSTLLPYNKEEGFHVPEMIYGGIKSVLSPEQARKYGNVTGQEGVETAMNVMGGGLGVSSGMRNATGRGGKDIGMFVGPQSKTWDLDKYGQALRSDELGVSPEVINRNTGYWQNPSSGSWSQEITDNTASLIQKALPKTVDDAETIVKNVLIHDPLFKAYPEIGDVRIKRKPGKGAMFNPDRNIIFLGEDIKDPKTQKSVLLHELQHWVQDKEGLPRGASYSEMAELPTPEMVEVGSKVYKYWSNPDPKARKKFNQFAEQYKALEDENSLKLYNRAEGEAQARATQERMWMDEQTRRNLTPLGNFDVPITELIQMGTDAGTLAPTSKVPQTTPFKLRKDTRSGFESGGLIEDDYTIDDLYRILGSK